MDPEQEDPRLTELREALRHMPSQTEPAAKVELDHCDEWSDQVFSWTNCNNISSPAITINNIPSLTTDQLVSFDMSSLAGISSPNGTGSVPYQIPSSIDTILASPYARPKIRLEGPDADIEINGESVVGMLRDIRDRLAILQVSEEMEQEWDELRELRQRYEAKLAECREKSLAWKQIKT